MAKQHLEASSNNTVGSLGLPDISSDPTIRQGDMQRSALLQDRLYHPDSNNLVQGRGINQNKSELDQYLPGGPDLQSSDTDIEHEMGQRQSTGEQLGESIARFAPGTAIKLAEMVTNLGAGVSYLAGNKDALDGKGAWNEYLNNVSDELKQALPIHSTTGYDTGNIAQKVFSSKFWTDDVSDGLQFVLAQAIGTKGLGAAVGAASKGLGALSKAANLGEIYNAVPVTQRIATAVANKFTTSTVGFLNAASISAMMAKGTANQIEARMRQDLTSKVNPDTGDYYTGDEIDRKVAQSKSLIDEKTDNTFWATMGTELLPSIYASKLFLGGARAEMGELNTNIMKAVNKGQMSLDDITGAVGEDVAGKLNWKAGRAADALQKTAGRSALTEAGHAALVGSAAMNLQTSIQKYDVDQATAGHAGGITSSAMGYARQFLDNLTDNEGLKGLVMGAVLGGLTGAVAGARNASEANEAMKAHVQSMAASEALFGEIPKVYWKTDPADPTNTKLILGKDGNPIPDPDKLTKLTFQMLHDKNAANNQEAAILQANTDMATLNEHTAMAQMIAKELQSGRYDSSDGAREYFKWFHKQRITEQSLEAQKSAQDAQVTDSAKNDASDPMAGDAAAIQTQTAMKTGSAAGDATISKYVNENSQLIDKMFGLWDTTGRQAGKLTRLGESSDRGAFNDNIRRALFYEGVKREALTRMVQDKEAEMKEVGADREGLNKQTEVLSNLMRDSENRSSDFLNKPDEVFDAWSKQNKRHAGLYTDALTARDKFEQSKDEGDRRASETKDYIWQEHVAKEGVNTTAGTADTDTFLTNEGVPARAATPIGLRNEANFKAGTDYMKLGRLNDMIGKVRTGEVPLDEAVQYATHNLTRIDDTTKRNLQQLIKEQQASVTEDEQKLAAMPDFDEETMQFNSEYQQLEQSIEDRKKAIEDSTSALAGKEKAQELETLSKQPDKIEETLNKQFAEKQFEKADNVIANALEEDGSVKDTYTDSRSVNEAIERLTRMRNAMEDRIKNGDLKGQDQYQYLINKADAALEKLEKIRNAVIDNMLKREGIQKNIAQQQAHAIASSLGATLDFNSKAAAITNDPVFRVADDILGGKLGTMLDQVMKLPSENYYEGTMAVLHAIKTKGSAEDLSNLTGLMAEHADTLLSMIPDPIGARSRQIKNELVDAPELYFKTVFQGLYKPNTGFEQASEDKGSPLSDFAKTNNIDELISRIEAMPDDTKELGTDKETALNFVRSYKEIVNITRTKNLINSKVDLSKTVGDEIGVAKDSSGIVPTAQQEVSIRDGLAWLSSNSTVGTGKYDGWGFLRGIAGTGKTSVAVKWLLDLSGLKPEEIQATAATEKAAGVLGEATGTSAMEIDKLIDGELPGGKKLIVIDEYARIPTDRLGKFEQKVREHNKGLEPSARVRVMILGDPTQITPELFANQDITYPTSNPSAKNIRVINPLTVVYRSDVSAVNEASDLFQANTNPVDHINVRSDKAKGQPGAIGVHVGSSSGDLIEGAKANMQYESVNGLTKRTRAVITEHPEKYAELAAAGVPIMSVYDSQSQTYDEVYIDLKPEDFQGIEKFNTAMYTAASRAKEYSYLNYNGTNTEDPGLSREKENNDKVGREAKDEYIKTRIEEQAMMESAVTGKDIAIPKSEVAVKIAAEQTPLAEATDPNTAEDGDIVTDIPSMPKDQVLPPLIDPEGPVNPETEQEVAASEPIHSDSLMNGERLLPNIEKGTFEALGGRGQEQAITNGSKVAYMYTKEANGENAITAFSFDKDGNWIPVSKIFQEEIAKHPQYAAWKAKVAGMQPLFTSDPQRLNGGGSTAAYKLEDLKAHQVDEGEISRHQKLTYLFDRNNVVPKGTLASHIKDIFKSKFFSPKASEQAKADKISFKIFRNNELSSHKFGGFTPEAGIPYAIIGADSNSKDWSKAQFVRLTANALSNTSEHYSALKSFRDAAKEIEGRTGISPGTEDFNRTVRALKSSLKIEHEQTVEGTEPKVKLRDDYTRKEFIDNLKTVSGKDSDFIDPTEHLTDDEFTQLLPKMQNLASMIYGIHKTEAILTPSELEKAHGTDYDHIPLKDGKTKSVTDAEGNVTEEPLGRARLKGTGQGTGKRDVYVPDWELNTKKGSAQQAFNQLAKSNEFVGNVRIRTDQYRTGNDKTARTTQSTGKSLITSRGGDAQVTASRKVLARILGETQVKEGKLDELDLKRKEVKSDLEVQIRKMAGEHDMDAKELGAKLLSESGLNEDRVTSLNNQLTEALNKKETPPITMKTLDLMVGDENYDANGRHLTQESYNVTNPKSGRTKETQTYLRTPLDIDQFNELGKSPEANAEELNKLVGTKFSDILPTQVAVRHGEPVEEKAPIVTPYTANPFLKVTGPDPNGISESLINKNPKLAQRLFDLFRAGRSAQSIADILEKEFPAGEVRGIDARFVRNFRDSLDIPPAGAMGTPGGAVVEDTGEAAAFQAWKDKVDSVLNPKPEPTIAPGSGRELQDKIDALSVQLATMKPGREKIEVLKEQRKLIDERDSTAKLYNENVSRGDKGQKITVEEATAEVKRMLPAIKDSELQFLNKSLMIELQRPGESLLGLFQKGKLFLQEDDGTVYSNVVRHEVFHKVFNDYLSTRERQLVAKEFDPDGKMNPTEFEEALADKFMTWQKQPEGFSGKVRRLFSKILNWIGFSKDNGSVVDKLFNDIHDGRFQKPDPDTSNTRMAFSDIRKWGTVQDYKDASRYLQHHIFEYFIDDNIKNDCYTQGELFDAIKQKLQANFNEESEQADGFVEGIDALTQEWYAADSDEERATTQSDIDVLNNELIGINQKLKMLHTFVNEPSAFKDIWKDLYPNFSFKKMGSLSTSSENPELDPEAYEKTEQEDSKDEGSIRSDFILNSDQKNQEGKISQNVKNFLSFIYRPATYGKNTRLADRVNPRGVYLLSLRNLANMRTGDADFIEQLKSRAIENGIDLKGKNDASIVIHKLLDLYNNATDTGYTFNEGREANGLPKAKRVELPRHSRFLDQDTFVKDLSGGNISGITEAAPEHMVISREGKTTPEFLKEITSSNITEEQAKGYFKQFQAQETLRELMSTFTSQREQTPMIAEEVMSKDPNTFGDIQLHYFRAQAYGTERIKRTDIENNFKENWDKAIANGWKDFSKVKVQDQNKAVAGFLKHLGVDAEEVKNSGSSLVKAIYGDIQAFKKAVEDEAASNKKTAATESSDSDESFTAANPVVSALEKNTGMLERLTRLLSRNSSDERASAFMNVKNEKRYMFHNGSQAHDTIESLKAIDPVGKVPDHLTKDPILSKNIFASGLNRISEMLDHDGMRQQGREEFASTYSDETNKQWLERNFSYGYLSFLKTHARDNADALTYAQQFYTISNRPRMNMARVEILSEPRIKGALSRAIEQHVEQPDHAEVKNYDRFKAVNFDEFHKAIEDIHKVNVGELRGKTEGRVELAKLYDKIAASDEMKSAIADHIIGQLKEQAGEAMHKMKAENVRLSSDANDAIKLLKDKRRQVLPDGALTPESKADGWPEDEQMRPSVENFYMNNYVNSYFLTQAVAGNMNYFKDGLDMVKRMSGIFAPGMKGIVGHGFFMKPKFNLAVSADMKMKADMMSEIFKNTRLMEAVGKKPFDLTDAQGYMLPERAANIVQGFGQSYNAGAVFKPAHYEVAERTLADGTKTYVPVMLKYSSVVLSDELVAKSPKLAALRAEMRAKGVHEFVFDTGVKVGAPTEQVQLPGVTAYDNNRINIDPKSVIELSNENYRLQLNPAASDFDKVANPTQLGYFLNVMHRLPAAGARNMENADKVYSAIAEKIQRGVARLSDSVLDAGGKIKTSVIKNSLSGPGNERLQEMLAAGLSYNMPNITDKALIQLASTIDKDTVKVKFPGGKMILQSSYGMDIPDGNGGQRRLEYKQDESGRWHAEVLLPKIYMDKANPGDFLLPDGMGFRIPSTELHSSIPFKVAGFYDDQGSNVVVAPAELVAQHGSDFDVDSLTVITREKADSVAWNHNSDETDPNNRFIEKDQPVGYFKNEDGKYEFNPTRFRAMLEFQKEEGAANKPLMRKLEKLHDQFLTNQITEAFLDTISHPDNKDRMLTPISTDILQDSLDKLGVKVEKSVNLSRLLDNLKMFNSNFQGASLVGIFANGMKSLSYISRAGENGDYPKLQGEDPGFEWNGVKYDSFGEVDHAGGNLWEQLDSFVNTAVDNVKEQKLAQMNATDKTGPAYVAAKALRMPLEEAMRMMLQPVIKQFSETAGGKKTSIDNLKKAIVEHAKGLELIESEGTYSDLRSALKPEEVKLTTANLNARLSSNSLGETAEELAHQMAVLDRFEYVNKVGQDLSTFSSAINILQKMPVFYEDISSKEDQWNTLGIVTDGKLVTNPDFSFKIDNLLQAQPNIAEAKKAFDFMKQSADSSLIKHFPEVKALADELASNMKIKLYSDENANRERLKNEVVNYLLSSYYSDELRDQKPVEVDKKKGGTIVLTGKQAWSQEFAEKMEAAIKEEKKTNPFMRRLAVQKDNYGIKTLQFANSSNPDPEEAMEMQEGFNTIKDQAIKDGLVKYGVLNFGLNFGARNYSMFIPSELLKPVSDFITKDMKSMVERSTLDTNGKLIAGPLRNIRDNLAIKLAINNPDSLPYLNKTKFPVRQMVDEAGKPRTVDVGDRVVPVLSGYDGKYFWHRSYDNPTKENGELTFNGKQLPEFIKQNDGNGRPVVYRRLNDPATDEVVYYQRTGYKNYSGGYDATNEVIKNGYNPDDYFAKGTIPVPVPDVRANEFETVNEHIKEGSRVVVYPYSNATREQGISGIVDKVRTSLGTRDKVVFTLRQEGEPDTAAEQQHLMDIAHNVTSRFGLSVATDTEMNTKGKVADGTVYLNPSLITRDTVFHEVAHPLIAAIAKQNPAWYSNLKEELHGSPEGRSILRKVQAKYPELSKEGQETEALVTAIGQEAANKLPESNFRSLVRRLMRSVGNMVRNVINEIRTKGGLSLESLASEDMAKLSMGDIADILAAQDIKLKLDLSKVEDEPQYSKDLGEEKPEKGSPMEAILAKSELIKDPERSENGQEGDFYGVEGKDALRVSKVMDRFTFRNKDEMTGPDGKPMSTIDAIAKREADRMFKNIAPGGKLIIDGIEQTREEFEDAKRKIQTQGILKGNIIHAKIQRFMATLQGDTAKVIELDHRIEELSSQADKLPSAYDWVTRKGVFNKLMENAGVNIGSKVAKGQEDKIHSEVKIASPTLGIAGKVDMMVERPDGRLRIVDWKTGAKLKDKYSATILKYGVQEGRITDNPLDRAKLQVMMYALTIKAEHPETQFDGLVVMHLPNEFEATQGRNALHVEIPDYLRMLEQYYRNEELETYKKLLEQSPRLFDPREYNAPLNGDFAQDVLNSNGSSEGEVQAKYRLQLQQLELSIAQSRSENVLAGISPEQLKLRADLVKKIEQGSDYHGADFDGALDSKYEIGIMKRWLGNLDDTHNPHIQAFSAHLRNNETKALKEIAENKRQFESLLRPVMKEYGHDRDAVRRGLTSVDYDKLWRKFYTETKTTDPESGVVYMKRGATTEKDDNWKAMSPAEQKLSVFMRKTMHDVYHEVMVNGDQAIVGKKLNDSPMTKQDLYNSSRKGANFKYTEDFMPRVAITREEVNTRLLRNFNIPRAVDYVKDAWLRLATDFFDNNAEGYNQKDYGLPVRMLGNANTYANPDSYSMNLERNYDKFMEQMIRKKHLDSTYMLGSGLKGIMENAVDANGQPAFKQATGFLDHYMKQILLGDSLSKGEGKLVRHGFVAGRQEGREYTISILRAYRSLKSLGAASTLWLQPSRSALNAAQMGYMHRKETAVNSILSKFGGLKANETDLSIGGSSYIEAMKGLVEAATNPRSSFVHALAKELRLYSTMPEEGGKPHEYLTRGCTLLDTSNFGFMYKIPEEVTNVEYGLNFLKNLEVQSGKYAGKSMYDMYKDNFNKETGTFDLPADFKRGKIQKGDGSYEDLAGLHSLELNKIHRGIAKIKGAYRADEKSAIQGTIMGDAFMMFKRWIPAMAIQQYQNKFVDPSIGQFELDKMGDKLKQKDGEDVYQWRARVVEGRFRTVANMILHMMNRNKYAGYAWSDLSGEQRKSVVDFGISMGTWASLLAFGTYAMQQRKEEESFRKFTENMTGRFAEQWWMPNMISAAIQPPALAKRAGDTATGIGQVLLAGYHGATGAPDNEIYTERGDIRGMNKVMKNVPLLSSYYETKRFNDEADYGSPWGTVSPF